MRHFNALRTRTKIAISLILSFALVTFGCAKNKNQVSDYSNIKISAETVPEGILVTFSNLNEILPKITDVLVAFRDWGGGEEPNWENYDTLASMNLLSNLREYHCENAIEQVRQTGKVIFPFAQTGHRYIITAYFYNGNLPEGSPESEYNIKTLNTECIADGGIYPNKKITLDVNNTRTGVALSTAPVFTSDVQFGHPKMAYSILIQTKDNPQAIASDNTDDLFWNFEPRFSKKLKETNMAKGDYPAYVTANLNIIHDNISWWLEIAKTPVFTYSL